MAYFESELIFFERTTQDSACFIDIAEKYKATTLEGHSQEKRKKNIKQKNSPGWIGTLTRETQLLKLTRLDWDVNTGNSTTQSGGTHDIDRKRPSRRDQPPIYTCSRRGDTIPTVANNLNSYSFWFTPESKRH